MKRSGHDDQYVPHEMRPFLRLPQVESRTDRVEEAAQHQEDLRIAVQDPEEQPRIQKHNIAHEHIDDGGKDLETVHIARLEPDPHQGHSPQGSEKKEAFLVHESIKDEHGVASRNEEVDGYVVELLEEHLPLAFACPVIEHRCSVRQQQAQGIDPHPHPAPLGQSERLRDKEPAGRQGQQKTDDVRHGMRLFLLLRVLRHQLLHGRKIQGTH